MRRTTPLILGGGPAGSAAAIALAAGGVRATILERSRDPADALCGGFLSWQTLAALERLGIAADALNPKIITTVRLFAGNRSAEARLPRPARGVSRRRLDAAMLDRAVAAGAGIERGVTVRELSDRAARLGDGTTIAADTILLATGKHELRGAGREAGGSTIGLRVHLRASSALKGRIELHLFDGGYAGLDVQEDGRANLCLAVSRARLHAAGDPIALLRLLARENPALADRLDGLDSAATVDAVANVPYGWRTRTTTTGVFRLGDQAAVIPSLAGEGMGIAIASGTDAVRVILAGDSAASFQSAFAARAARPMAVAGLVRRLAERPPTARLLATLAGAPWLVRAVASLTRIKHSDVDDGA